MKETQIRHRKQKSAFETNRRAPLRCPGLPGAAQGVGTVAPRPHPQSAQSGQKGQAPP